MDDRLSFFLEYYGTLGVQDSQFPKRIGDVLEGANLAQWLCGYWYNYRCNFSCRYEKVEIAGGGCLISRFIGLIGVNFLAGKIYGPLRIMRIKGVLFLLL